jgi:cell division septum initiation protein DivIVA
MIADFKSKLREELRQRIIFARSFISEGDTVEAIIEMILSVRREAVEAEREACAQVADNFVHEIASHVARIIRARGKGQGQ